MRYVANACLITYLFPVIIRELSENRPVASMLLVLCGCRCRSSVLTVSGTGLNTRRSPSVMRSVSIGWRWTGTAVTPAMLLWLQHIRTILPMEWCFPLKTATTTYQVLTAPMSGTVDGGTNGVAQVSSTMMTSVSGRLSATSKTWKLVACWSNSTSKPDDDQVSSQIVADACNLYICLYVARFLTIKHAKTHAKAIYFDTLKFYVAQ